MIQGFSGGLLNRELIYNLDLPSFQRDFASLKTLDHGTGPNIAFERLSGATYFDADGVLQTAANDVPRFDHDPATGASSLGLLIEEARTNLHLRSEDFSTGWTTTATHSALTVDAGVDGLDGVADVGKFVCATTDGNTRRLYASADITTVSGTEYTFSVYLKPINSWPMVLIQLSQGTAVITQYASAKFDLSNGTVANVATGTASIQAVGNGWYRCSATSSGNLITGMRPKIILIDDVSDGAATAVTGIIDAGVYVWGAQLEAGAFPTSYIPTTSAAATRSADSAVVTPISSFYNQSEGTLFAESSSTALVAGDNQGIWGLGDDTLIFASGNMLYATYLASVSHRIAITGAVSGASTVSSLNNSGVPQSANTPARSIFGYKTDDFAISTNGSSVATDTSGALPVVTGFSIGGLQKAWSSGGNQLNGHIRKIAYWPKRLTNTLLEQLTT